MKLIKIKPRLVDPRWMHPKRPVPVSTPVRVIKEPPTQSTQDTQDISFYFNLIAFLILAIGGFLLYKRLCNRETDEQDKQTRILTFNQYVQDNL